MNEVDILAIGAHPDDVEIGCGATVLRCIEQGQKVAVVDLTSGELGSRGSGALRKAEAANAAKMLGLANRECLNLPDGFFRNDRETMLMVIGVIRKYRPRIILANTPGDRHPDHGRASSLVAEAGFYAGLRKIETKHDNKLQSEWRPQSVYFYLQDYYHKPDFVVDVSAQWEKKIEVLRCYSSQFYNPHSAEPETPISRKDFFDFLRARAIDFGRPAGLALAEGFIAARVPVVENLFHLA